MVEKVWPWVVLITWLKAMFNINKVLDDENTTIKDKAELSIKYLRTTTSYLSKSINEFTFNSEKILK